MFFNLTLRAHRGTPEDLVVSLAKKVFAPVQIARSHVFRERANAVDALSALRVGARDESVRTLVRDVFLNFTPRALLSTLLLGTFALNLVEGLAKLTTAQRHLSRRAVAHGTSILDFRETRRAKSSTTLAPDGRGVVHETQTYAAQHVRLGKTYGQLSVLTTLHFTQSK